MNAVDKTVAIYRHLNKRRVKFDIEIIFSVKREEYQDIAAYRRGNEQLSACQSFLCCPGTGLVTARPHLCGGFGGSGKDVVRLCMLMVDML